MGNWRPGERSERLMAEQHRIALVTGPSRGIGAEVARIFGRRGLDVIVHYRTKQRRAEAVAETIRAGGAEAILVPADLTAGSDRERLLATAESQFGRLDLLVLNASGGLERDAPADYAMQLNRDAQLHLAELALPLMPRGGRIVFVTNHFAHFYDTRPVHPDY